MRPIITGLVAGACVCVLAVAIFGFVNGDTNPEGYPPGLLPELSRPVAACLQVLAYFGPLAAAAGALAGGGIGAVIAAMRWLGVPGTQGAETANSRRSTPGGRQRVR
jgi:hypothetical protein